MTMAEPIWRIRDTIVTVLSIVLPILTGACSLLTYDEISLGTVSIIELDWTFWACVGILVSVYKVYLLGGDQRALVLLNRGPREWLIGMWTLSNAVGFGFTFLVWAGVGFVAMQFPTNPIPRVAGVPPQFITGGLFILG